MRGWRVLLAACLLTAGPAQALERQDSGITSFGGGLSQIEDFDDGLALQFTSGQHYAAENWGLTAGLFSSFTQNDTQASVDFGWASFDANVSVLISSLNFAVSPYYRFGDLRVFPTIGGGVDSTITMVEFPLAAVSADLGYVAGGGLDYRIGDNLGLRFDAMRIRDNHNTFVLSLTWGLSGPPGANGGSEKPGP